MHAVGITQSLIEKGLFKIIAVWCLIREVNNSVKKTGVKQVALI